MQESPPNLSEFGRWLGFHLRNDGPTLKQAPLGLLAVFVFSLGIAWALAWPLVVREKNEQLVAKQESIEYLTMRLNIFHKECDRLSKENEELTIGRPKDSLSLKKSALILASQIHDCVRDWKDSDDPSTKEKNVQNYFQRFELRASAMRDDLDRNGQNSPEFDKVINNFDGSYQDVRIIADQIQKLAGNLSD
jgi:hypothetical protein